MNPFFVAFFLVYAAVNSYIFVRCCQALEITQSWRYLFAFAIVFASVAYIVAKIFSAKLHGSIYFILTWVGSFWFFVLLYVFLFLLLIDAVRILNAVFHFLPEILFKNYALTKILLFAFVLLSILVLGIFGYIHRSSIKVKEINIEVNNRGKEYRILFFSDLHISVINNHKFLETLVDKVNRLEPDVVLIGGDIVDEKPEKLEEYGLTEKFKDLRAKFGIFAITGNHEYINGAEKIIGFIEGNYNIKFLRDTSVLIDNSFYIVGREDRSSKVFSRRNRKNLAEILKDIPQNAPKILLDHQPFNLDEATIFDFDLQLSGHTHNGQIFPLNLITNLLYEVSWGYKRKGKTHIYVSSGVGTWGPPVKIGSDAEIVLIRFKI
ncbi:metallophosphoesterase [Bacteroidetes/Chlorobi group bacterium MS-B_bin-24]|jgi:hypothetical protein|nr:MAG: metallophosphoesterase [Bacteroidetes/Chlorobi group bacterium MS-B_bin-24]